MSRSVSFKRAFQLALLAAVIFTFLGADQDARFQSVGHQLMCACGCNQVLLECNHVGCPMSDGMRNELASYIQRGDSDNLVMQAFVQKYGPTVLLAPTATGFNRLAWIMPFAVLAIGLGLIYFLVRAWRKRAAPLPAGGVAPAHGEELERYSEQVRKETEV
jgi:cytochrome c-type biogenesis protein CcmH/NrfF